MRKLIINGLLIFFLQLILFVIPYMYFNDIVQKICLFINIFITWYLIKDIEKKYYKKYNKLPSLLYMACPVIGIIVIWIVLNTISNISVLNNRNFTMVLRILADYYVSMFACIYIVNIVYVIINYIHKK